MKKLLVLFAFAVLLLGCIGPVTEEPEEIPEGPVEPEGPTAYYGDFVSVDYILYVDDEVYDTSIEDVARDADLYNPFRKYVPLNFTLELDSGFINGFVKGIIGMRENETRTFMILPSSDSYGVYNASRAYNVPRYYNMSAFEVVPRSYFEERNISIEEGTAFTTDIAQVFVHNVSGDDITIMYVFHQGDEFRYGGFRHVVVASSSDLVYTIMLDVEENETYTTTSLVDGRLVLARATKVTNDTITFDENHPLAGKTLVYDVTLVDLVKAGYG